MKEGHPMPIYNKLIRDQILEIIEKDGKTYDMEILSEERHEEEIKAKLTEEVRIKKKDKHGDFDKGIYLIEVYDT